MSLRERYAKLPERSRKIVRIGAYSLFGAVVFLATLYLSFPWQKANDRIASALSQAVGMDVSIGEVRPSLWPGLSLRDLYFRGAPPRPGDKPATVYLDRVTVHPGLWAALTGRTAVALSADVGGGDLDADVTETKPGWAGTVSLDQVSLDKVQGLAALVGIPFAGALSGTVSIALPPAGVTAASGSVSLHCDSCAVGDGVAKIKLPGPFGEGGLTLPRIRLGKLDIQVDIARGLATIKTFHAQSSDGELFVEGSVALGSPLEDSRVQLYLRFKLDQALLAREAALQFLVSTMAAGQRSDGFYGEKIVGTLRAPRLTPSKEGFASALEHRAPQAPGAFVPGRPTFPRTFRPNALPLPVAPPLAPPPPRPSDDTTARDNEQPQPAPDTPAVAPSGIDTRAQDPGREGAEGQPQQQMAPPEQQLQGGPPLSRPPFEREAQ